MTIKLYNVNLVDQSSLTPSSENLQFPVGNLKDPRRTKVFQTLENSSNLILDFQETSEVNTVIITDNHKSGFGISSATLQLNSTSNFTSPAESFLLDPFSVKHGVGFTVLDQVYEYRFARLVLNSSLDYCELSKIYIGKSIDLIDDKSINFGWSYQNLDLSVIKSNRYGQDFTDIITRQKVMNMSFSNLTKDQLAQLHEIFDEKGLSKPFWIRLGCDNMTDDYRRFSGMVKLKTMPTETNAHFNRWNLSMQIEEVK